MREAENHPHLCFFSMSHRLCVWLWSSLGPIWHERLVLILPSRHQLTLSEQVVPQGQACLLGALGGESGQNPVPRDSVT